MTTETYELKGAFYQPRNTGSPALAILASVPMGIHLFTRPEPQNPHDQNAVGVHISTTEMIAAGEACLTALDQAVANFGLTIEDLTHVDEWQLGYLPKGQASFAVLMRPYQATLRTGLNSKYMVEIDLDKPLEN